MVLAPDKSRPKSTRPTAAAVPPALPTATRSEDSQQPIAPSTALPASRPMDKTAKPPVFSAQPSLVFPDLQPSEDLDVAWLSESPTAAGSSEPVEESAVAQGADPRVNEVPSENIGGESTEATEVLGDDLFLGLEPLDAEVDSQVLRIEGIEAAVPGQVISVRCRVCDTLQYVENRAGRQPTCDVCHAPLPLNADGTPMGGKGPGRAAWTAPATMVRNVAAEGVGAVEQTGAREQDEIDELIRTVQTEPLADSSASPAQPAAAGDASDVKYSENDNELVLAPLETGSGTGLDLLLLDEETRSLLHAPSPSDDLIETAGDELLPIDDDSDVSRGEAPLGKAPRGGVVSERTGGAAEGLSAQPIAGEVRGEIESWRVITPPPRVVETGSARESAAVAGRPQDSLTTAASAMPPHSVSLGTSAPVTGTTAGAGPQVSGGGQPPMPPVFLPGVTPGGATGGALGTSSPASLPPYLRATAGHAGAAEEQASAPASAGSRDEQVEQFLQRAVVSLWHLVRAIIRPFGSWQLWGTALLLLPLLVLMQSSWLAAAGDGKPIERITGFCYLILSAAAGLPLWLGMLGVIANRQSAWGQDGRLTWSAIAWQAGQFAVVLAASIPGGALATPFGVPLLIGCMAAYTMLPGGLYLVTTAIVSQDWLAVQHPTVWRSFSERLADWAAAAVVVGLLLLVGTLVALITSYLSGWGPALFAVFVIPASMAYAATIGFMADRIQNLAEN